MITTSGPTNDEDKAEENNYLYQKTENPLTDKKFQFIETALSL